MSFEIYYDNLLHQSTITTSSENLQFPISNIKDPRRTKVFRSTSNTAHIILDFNETSEVDSFVITDNKFTGFGVSTITLEFNGTNEWSDPAATEVVTFDPIFGLGIAEFETKSYRFCRILLTSTLGYCEISKFFIGKKMSLGRSINFGWTIKGNDLSAKQSNRYGQVFVDVIARQKVIGAALSLLDKDQLDKINAWLDLVSETKPFFIRIGCGNMVNNNKRFSGMVYLSDVPTISNPNFGRYNLSMNLIEAT